MNIDYRELCKELFGTDDVEQLRQIAAHVKQKDTRGAGRKPLFTEEDVKTMRTLLENGMSITELAQKYHTSRQVIGKYLNLPPAAGCTLRLTYMYRQHPCTIIDVDFLHQKIYIQNRTADLLHRAFGVISQPTWEDFENFLRDRCFPETRGNARQLLKDMQMDCYDPLRIVEKTGGRMADDDLWIKFTYCNQQKAAPPSPVITVKKSAPVLPAKPGSDASETKQLHQ